jgi:predicted nuclease of restriction endonuclease-like (RecB) superfamily
MKGFSPRNLKYMRKFAEECPDLEFMQQVVALLPWEHNLLLMEKLVDRRERLFYINKVIEHGWSRHVMEMQVETKLYQRQGKVISNFRNKLPPFQVEKSLLQPMEKFLLELGAGFAFVGRQYHLEIAEQGFFIDLLFYHLKLRCFVVIELKDKDFKPEYAGKTNFYLSAVDNLIKHEHDQPSIGLVLCRSRNAEYNLRDMTKSIDLAESLPENLKTQLPTIEALKAELLKRGHIRDASP